MPTSVREEDTVRIVFVGGGETATKTTELLIQRGHEVVIIDEDPKRLEVLTERLDCSFLEGDGSKPHILEQAGPELTDVLFCLSGSDQDNIIASLVGRSMGFKRVITRIEDGAFENVCYELGLKDVVIPSRTISHYLSDMAEGLTSFELSSMIKDEARLFTFVVGEDDTGTVGDLELPEDADVICYYRNGRFSLVGEDDTLNEGDEVVILTHSENLNGLRERWQPAAADELEK